MTDYQKHVEMEKQMAEYGRTHARIANSSSSQLSDEDREYFYGSVICQTLVLPEAVECLPRAVREIVAKHHDNPGAMPQADREGFLDGHLARFADSLRESEGMDTAYLPVVDAFISCIRADVLREWADSAD